MKFLFFGQNFSGTQLWLEASVSAALKFRGHEALHVPCAPRAFGVCDVFNVDSPLGSRELACSGPCTKQAEAIFRDLGIASAPLNSLWTPQEADEAARWASCVSGDEDLRQVGYKGYPLFQIAKWSAYRYLRRTDTVDPNGRDRWIFTEMMKNARVALDVAERVLANFPFDAVLVWNGLNVTQRAAVEVARRLHIPFYAFEVGLNKNTCVMAQNQTAVPWNFGRAWAEWENRPLSEAQRIWIEEYLRSRERRENLSHPCGSGDPLEREELEERLEIPPGAKIVPLFTNVTWDTTMEEVHRPFENQLRWIEATCEFFATRPDHVCVIRIHPGEMLWGKWETREPVWDLIRHLSFPPNVRIVRPETELDSYSLMRHASFGVPYISTAGIELACKGKPVITAGNGQYRGKGFTWDPESREHYAELLRRLCCRPEAPPNSEEMAKRYAYMFFRWASQRLDFMEEPMHGVGKPLWRKVSDLAPGSFPCLDRIVDTVLGRRNFIPSPDEDEVGDSAVAGSGQEARLPFNLS